MEYNYVHLKGAKCGLDIGDGSERGEYVCQDYMLSVLGRPHRMVNIMYTYYPKDNEWPQRISQACKDMEINFQWDYPYDDYFPYDLDSDEAFNQMRDIRKHGQDVMLTLTIDCSLEDDELRKVARSFRPFGRMCVRINHECYGNWFTHNKRFSYEEIDKFFVRFSRIIKEEAPQVRTIFCAGRVEAEPEDGVRLYDALTGEQKIKCEDEFLASYNECDIVSADRYLALHYGWPCDVAEPDDPEGRYYADCVDKMYEEYKNTYERIRAIAGDKPFIQAEFNTDGDVTGPAEQGESVLRYYGLIRDKDEGFIKGISMYQFRDRGRLGLEIEDPNCKSVGIRQPIMDDYMKILSDPYFSPGFEAAGPVIKEDRPEEKSLLSVIIEAAEAAKEEDAEIINAKLRWGSSEDADGIETIVEMEGNPVFFEVSLAPEDSIMIEAGGRWFYKGRGVSTIDLMPAFFYKNVAQKAKVPIRFFATPPDGENQDDGSLDHLCNYYTTMKKAPKFRIRYKAPGAVR